jgi:hypothetical protein
LLAAVVVCVAVWLLLSLRFSLGFNSHYVDESDYMFAGRLLLDGSLWPTKTYIFSSNLPLYLIGWGANLDYEYGARALSLIPGLFSLGALYLLYLSMLGNRTLALLAAALIGLQATHIFQSKLATYDIWCFFLFVTAAWQLHSHARTRRHLSLQMICGSLLFACAVLSKYVVVIYAPLFFALLWIGSSRGSAVLFAILQTLVLGIYAMQNAAELQILFNTQLAGQHLHNSSGWQVLWLLGGLLWPLLIMTPASIWKTLRRQQSFLDLPAINRNSLKVLIILAIALPAYHLISGNRIAMYKHALYSAIFLAPVAAAGLALMVRSLKPGFQAPVASLVLALLTVIAVLQTRAMESAFPDTRAVMSVLDQQVTHRSRILSENPYLHRSHFLDRIALQNLYDMDSLPAAGSPENDARLVREFITAGFDFVLLDGRFDPARTALLRANMPAHYELVHSEPYATSDISSGNTHGEITLYRAIDQSPHY